MKLIVFLVCGIPTMWVVILICSCQRLCAPLLLSPKKQASVIDQVCQTQENDDAVITHNSIMNISEIPFILFPWNKVIIGLKVRKFPASLLREIFRVIFF